jgi:hypothetical protein
MADKRRRFVYVTDGHAVDGKVSRSPGLIS